MLCIKMNKDKDKPNDIVASPQDADMISYSKDDYTKKQVQAWALVYNYKGSVRESVSGKQWNVYKAEDRPSVDDYKPTDKQQKAFEEAMATLSA